MILLVGLAGGIYARAHALFTNIQEDGLKEPPAPLSVHVTNPAIVEDGFGVSVIVTVNEIEVPPENVAGFGVMVEVVGSTVAEDNVDVPVLA